MTKHIYRFLFLMTMALLGIAPSAFSQNPRDVLNKALVTHKAWQNAPSSIEISGVSTRGNASGPVRITATREEETLTEFGGKKYVATGSRRFEDDGQKIAYASAIGGFGQLDITGVFLLTQLSQRAVQVSDPVKATLLGRPVSRVNVSDKRDHLDFVKVKTTDRVDLYFDEAGLLAAISRDYYEQLPDFAYSLSYVFSNYREDNGVLLPHRIEVYLKNKRVETLDVTGYNVNVPAAPSLFVPRRSK